MIMKKNITIVIPCFNEEIRIVKTFKLINKWYKKQNKINLELLLINDGSKDQTSNIINDIAKKNKFVKAYQRKHYGYINSLFFGFKKAKYTIVGNTEADNAIDIEYFSKFLNYLETHDVVTADRTSGDFNKININKSFFRKCLSRTYLLIFKLLFKSKINDTQAGFRLYKNKRILIRFINKIKIKHDGLKIAELILKMEKYGYKIKQIPVVNKHDNDSRLVPKLAFINIFKIISIVCNVFINLFFLRSIIHKNEK